MFANRESRVTVSSDLGGFFANPERVQHIYEMAKFNADIELVLMPYQIFYLNQLAEGNSVNFDVGGFHGQLGSVESFRDHEKGLGDWLLIKLFDSFLPKTIKKGKPLATNSTLQKVEKAASNLNKSLYFNVHEDVVARNFRAYQIATTLISDRSILAIENGPGSRDVAKTKDLITRLRDGGSEHVEGTFDLVHAVVGLIGGAVPEIDRVSKHWNTAIAMIDQNFSRIHLPIGRKAGDSLPIMEMLKEKNMLRDLGAIVASLGLSVTLENQQSLLFGATDVMIEVDRLKAIHDGLQESGIIRNS